MNLVLLFDDDFVAPDGVRLAGRRLEHIAHVHRVAAGDELSVGVAGGRMGRGTIVHIDPQSVEMEVRLDRDPPPPSPVTLVVAVPRPKVLNRVVASAASMGIKRICLINAWRVEKSYFGSPRLSEDNLRAQAILGLEQAKDTVLPAITVHRFFRRFVEEELPHSMRGRRLVAHPAATVECPRNVRDAVTIAIGPEGGFIAEEIASLERAGFEPVALGERILRVETAVAWAVARLS